MEIMMKIEVARRIAADVEAGFERRHEVRSAAFAALDARLDKYYAEGLAMRQIRDHQLRGVLWHSFK
jgi:hypothetical protein